MKMNRHNSLKLLFTLTMAVILTVTSLPNTNTVQAASFPDTNAAEVLRLAENDIVKGNTQGEFKPDQHVTRAEAAIMMTRALNLSTASGDTPFTDIGGHFAEGEITRAFSEGLIQGNSDNTYRPDQPITRAEMATILTRGFTYDKVSDVSFPDVPSSNFFHGYITTLANAGIIEGDSNGHFNPGNNISRLHFSFMLARTLYDEFRPNFEEAESPQEPEPELTIPQNLETAPGDKARVTVSSGNLNLRSTPDTLNNPIGSLSDGTVVEVHGKTGDWAFIEYNNQMGYVSMYFIDFNYENPPEPEPSPDVDAPSYLTTSTVGIVARTATLNIRPSASTNQSPIGKLREGDMVNVHGTTGSWVEISTADTRGYVHHAFLTTMARSAIGSLKGKTIVVDAGHGGTDSGGTGNGLLEKHIVLDIGLRVEAQLQAAGANVVMTRRTDDFLTLGERVTIANNSGADIFISLHANAAWSTAARGTETFYNTTYWAGDSKKLADSLQKSMLNELNTVDRGVKTANFQVIRYTRMPSALVEFAFMTNANDAERLKTTTFREASADSMLKGTIEYFQTK